MIVQSCDWRTRHADVQDDHLARIHGNGGEIIRVLLVPRQSQQRSVLRVLIDYRRVLQVPQIEHPYGSVGTDGREHVAASPGATERDIVHLLVVSDQLRFHMPGDHVHPAQHLSRLQSPDRARGVYAGGAD